MSSQSPVSVTLAGQSYDLKAPSSFLERETLQVEINALTEEDRASEGIMRAAWSAFAGAYLPSLLPADLTLKSCRWRLLPFGEAVYEHLRAQGCKPAEIVSAGFECLKLNRASLAPREHEVAEETGN